MAIQIDAAKTLFRVRLTDFGRSYPLVNVKNGLRVIESHPEDEEGWSLWTLMDLIKVYGSVIHFGGGLDWGPMFQDVMELVDDAQGQKEG